MGPGGFQGTDVGKIERAHSLGDFKKIEHGQRENHSSDR